jgi:hypothetical protein
VVLFQNCVRQLRSPTKIAATVQLRCYWKQLWSRWAITGSWEPLVSSNFLKIARYVDLDMLNMFAVSTYHLSLIVFWNKGWKVLKFRKFDEKGQKCLACQNLQNISHSWKCATSVWRVNPLEIHFFVDLLLLVTQIMKGKQLYYKIWSSKS